MPDTTLSESTFPMKALIPIYRLILRRFLGPIHSVSTAVPAISLTFDDGPHPVYTNQLLEILSHYRARATFFVLGKNAVSYPQLIRKILREGHSLGNHSWNHDSFSILSRDKVFNQIRSCQKVLPVHGKLLRPPFGHLKFLTCMELFLLGYKIIDWSISGGDWEEDGPPEIFKRIERQLKPGAIILMHDSLCQVLKPEYAPRENTIHAVELLLEKKSLEYKFVTVTELLKYGKPHRANVFRKGNPGWLRSLSSISYS